jgi:hypothetical protein
VAQVAHALIAQEEIVVDLANRKLQDVLVEITVNALIAKEEIAVAPLHVVEKPLQQDVHAVVLAIANAHQEIANAVSSESERRLPGLKLPLTTMDSKTSS